MRPAGGAPLRRPAGRLHRAVLIALAVLGLSACGRHAGAAHEGASGDASRSARSGAVPEIALGDVVGAAALAAGAAASAVPAQTESAAAYASTQAAIPTLDARRVADGQALFMKMNCASCHGYGAGGGMGPDLTDPYWRYGAAALQVYRSIHDGRPQGMPAWGRALSSDEVWSLVAYVRSLNPAAAGDGGSGRGAAAAAPAKEP